MRKECVCEKGIFTSSSHKVVNTEGCCWFLGFFSARRFVRKYLIVHSDRGDFGSDVCLEDAMP